MSNIVYGELNIKTNLAQSIKYNVEAVFEHPNLVDLEKSEKIQLAADGRIYEVNYGITPLR